MKLKKILQSFFTKPIVWVSLSTLWMSGCAVGPDYQRPEVVSQVDFKNVPQGWAWAGATANQATDWWKELGDAQLNGLIQELHQNNPSIAEAYANFESAQANLSGSRSDWFPSVKINGSGTRSGTGVQSLSTGATSKTTSERYSAGADIGWEIDLWGAVARQIEAGEATAMAREADWQGVMLSMEIEFVRTYFQVRYLDEQLRLNRKGLEVRRRVAKIIQNKLQQEMITIAEYNNAQSQVATLEANIISLERSRAQAAHALASLLGKTPSQFNLNPVDTTLPSIHLVLEIPSSFLERRPDIISAEQKVRAANAQIGVKQASYFPSISLNASISSNAAKIADLFTAPARAWSIGGNILEMLFDGGARSAQLEAARAAYDAAVAQYRKTVLQAFVEVENGIVAVNTLTQEVERQKFAEFAAGQARKNASNAFEVGQADYQQYATEEINAIQTTNSSLNTQLSLELEKLNLIKAVGGGWQATAP